LQQTVQGRTGWHTCTLQVLSATHVPYEYSVQHVYITGTQCNTCTLRVLSTTRVHYWHSVQHVYLTSSQYMHVYLTSTRCNTCTLQAPSVTRLPYKYSMQHVYITSTQYNTCTSTQCNTCTQHPRALEPCCEAPRPFAPIPYNTAPLPHLSHHPTQPLLHSDVTCRTVCSAPRNVSLSCCICVVCSCSVGAAVLSVQLFGHRYKFDDMSTDCHLYYL
jgi:hypothetical protein